MEREVATELRYRYADFTNEMLDEIERFLDGLNEHSFQIPEKLAAIRTARLSSVVPVSDHQSAIVRRPENGLCSAAYPGLRLKLFFGLSKKISQRSARMKQVCFLAIVVAMVLSAEAQTYTYSTLVNFSSLNNSPQFPSDLIIDTQGNLYGTSEQGGTYNFGTVFKVTKGVAKRLYNFKGSPADGAYPLAALTRDKTTGDLYGTTLRGGAVINCIGFPGCGTVFKLTSSGKETVLHSFTDGSDGGFPDGTLTLDSNGNLYGIANGGGQEGLVFKLTTTDVFSNVYDFGEYLGNGATLIKSQAGNFYGTNYQGGQYSYGTIYEITPEGQETTLYTFTGGSDGWYPNSKLTQDAAGNLYGSALGGGTAKGGVVFKLTPAGVYSVLYSFCQLPNCADGQLPNGWLTLDSVGNLYGMTENDGPYVGVVFKVTPSGEESVIYSPVSGQASDQGTALVMDKSGNLYGSTFAGGTYGLGAIFKLTKN